MQRRLAIRVFLVSDRACSVMLLPYLSTHDRPSPLLSQISSDLSGTAFDGDMFLQNVFNDDPTLDEFITFALSRSETTGNTDGGIFTVGEIASNLTSVSNNPKLDVVLKTRWTVLMDGVIVNGKRITGNSALSVSVFILQKREISDHDLLASTSIFRLSSLLKLLLTWTRERASLSYRTFTPMLSMDQFQVRLLTKSVAFT